MKKSFKFGVTIVAARILVAGVVASMNFGSMSAEVQTTIHGNQTANAKTMTGNNW
jgi:hypothetical protein